MPQQEPTTQSRGGITIVSTDAGADVTATFDALGIKPDAAETPSTPTETPVAPTETPKVEEVPPVSPVPSTPPTDDDETDIDVPETADPAIREAASRLSRRSGKLQSRIDKLKFQNYQTEAQRDDAMRQVAHLQSQVDALKAAPKLPEPVAVPASTTDKPRADEVGTKYKTYEDFVEALSDWKADQKTSALKAELDQKAKTERETAAQQAADHSRAQLDQTYIGRAVEFIKTKPDFEEVVSQANFTAPPMMLAAIKNSEHGPEMAYEIAKSPELAKRLLTMREGPLLMALGELQADIKARHKAAATPPADPAKAIADRAAAQKAAGQTPPINPVNSAITSTSVEPKPDGTNWAEWNRQREEEVAARRKRQR